MSESGDVTFLASLCDLCKSAEEKEDRRISLQVQRVLRTARMEGVPFPQPCVCLLEVAPFANCPLLAVDVETDRGN